MSWPWRRKRFRAYKFLDEHDIEMLAAEYDDKPFWLSVGTPKGRKTHAAVDVGKEGIGAERDVEKMDLHWEHFVNPHNLPPFMPLEQAKIFMQGTIATASGSMSVVTSSSEPIVYENRDTIENVIKELDISSVKFNEVINLSANFFVKNIKVELEYPNMFSGTRKYPIWQPVFLFINLIDKPTSIFRATLKANEGKISTINDKLKIDLNRGMSERRRVDFHLDVSLDEIKWIEGTIIFTHTYGQVSIDINYEINGIVIDLA